jgi:hypothetical protein
VGYVTGKAAEETDVEAVLRPLHDRWSERGLQLVGVSMDKLLPPERLDQIRRDWDEWGRDPKKIQDGSLATVRRGAEDYGIVWPWAWDGKWIHNPVSRALGGVGVNVPHAVLVDAGGVIRWRGDAPFKGLPEAVETLMK